MPFEPDATMRAARILIGQDPGPGDRLDAFLLLTGLELLWRRTRPCPIELAVRSAPLGAPG